MIELRQSTAGQEIPLGYFLDSRKGDTEKTGLAIANTDIKIWKWGATTLVNKNSGGATHISNGIYYAVLDATDTNTLGPLVIFVHESGALTCRLECAVIPTNVWNSKYSTDKLQVHVAEFTNDIITAASLNADAMTKIITALKTSTGYTAGGTYTFANLIKITLACLAGQFQLKSGETDVYEVLDIEDGATVIAEITLSKTTSPYRQSSIS